MNAAAVLDSLKRLWPATSHAWLYEVNNATGHAAGRQFADALVVSTWPSRGLWIAGVEVKVDRRDWLRELKDPRKSAEIQAYCNRWWVAAPPGVVEIAEAPATWGLVVLDGKKRPKVVKQAPELTPNPLSVGFVASVLRNRADHEDNLVMRGRNEVYREFATKEDKTSVDALEEKVQSLTYEGERLRARVTTLDNDKRALAEAVARFEEAAGLDAGTVASCRVNRWGNENTAIGPCFRAALAMRNTPATFIDTLEEAARALRGAQGKIHAAAGDEHVAH